MPPRLNETIEKRTFAVLVDNEPGVLARVVGFSQPAAITSRA